MDPKGSQKKKKFKKRTAFTSFELLLFEIPVVAL